MSANNSQRGVTMIETMIAMGVMLVGMLGMAHMQVLAVRSNEMAAKLAMASSLAQDLTQSVARWNYDDPRLAPLATLDAFSDTQFSRKIDLGRQTTVGTTARPQFAENASDSNGAVSAAPLGANDGISPDVDMDGKPDFARYWTVFGFDPDHDGIANGKMVLIVVRWKEPGLGFRQVTMTTFRFNAAALSL